MTRVLIVASQPAYRRHLRELLVFAGLEVVGEAGDISTAETLARELQPELAVVDIVLPGLNGLEGTPRLRAAAPGLRVYLVSAYRDRANAFQDSANSAGAAGFILKDDLNVQTVRGWK